MQTRNFMYTKKLFASVVICYLFISQLSFGQTNPEALRVRENVPDVIMKSSSSAPPEYCNSFGGSTTFERISNVNVVEKPGNLLEITVNVFIANPTGCVSGEPCPIYDNSPEYINVWIDWNGNFVWEPHERVLAEALDAKSINYRGTMTTKTTVSIPSSAKRPTWLRANLGWGYNPSNPCEQSWSFGNVVDLPVLWNVRVKKLTASRDIVVPEFTIAGIQLPLWEALYGSNGELIESWSPRPVIGSMKPGWFNLHVDLVSFPEEVGENVRTELIWDVIGERFTGRSTSMVGKSGVIPVTIPRKIGFYKMKLRFIFRGDQNNIVGEQVATVDLWVTHNEPKIPIEKEIHLRRAIEWTEGSSTPHQMAEKMMNGIYERSGWRYIDGAPFEVKFGLLKGYVDGELDWGNCRTMANIWTNLLLTMGVDGAATDGHKGRHNAGFMAPAGLTAFGNLASANGNARGFIDQRFDRWVFASHWFGKLGNRYYDPTFNLIGDDFYYHIDYDIVNKDGNTYTTSEGGPTLYHWESNFTHDEGNWPKYRYRFPILGKIDSAAEVQNNDARFTGSYAEITIDSDDDGIFNQLEAAVEIEITDPGEYTVLGEIQKNGEPITSRSNYFDPSPWVETIGPQTGIYEVHPRFSGEEIYRNAQDGPYEMWLVVADSTGIAASDTFTTAAYASTQFGELPSRLAQITETARDTDDDGFFDDILVDINLLINLEMSYTIDITLQHTGRTLVSTSETRELTVGNTLLSFTLPADGIAASGLNGPYTLFVQIIDQNGEQTAYREMQTSEYSAGQFSPPDVFISGGSADAGIDTDGDGFFDSLRVDLNVEIQRSGAYTIRTWLGDQDDEQITWTEFVDSFSTGSTTVSLNFPGPIINESQLDGPYVIAYATVTGNNNEPVFSGDNLYVTNEYTASQFNEKEAALITFTGNISERTVDADGNGMIDSLFVEVEVVPRDSGNVVAYGRLMNDEGRTLLWSFAIEFLQEGVAQSIDLAFDGRYIFGGLLDGPFHLRNLQIYHVGDPEQTIDVDEAYTTQFYEFDDFEPAGVITGSVSDSIGAAVSNVLLLVPELGHDFSNAEGKYNLVLLEEGDYWVKVEGPDTLRLDWSIFVNGTLAGTGDSVQVPVVVGEITEVNFVAPVVITDVTEPELSAASIPSRFYLEQNYPNPFNPETTIRYDVPELSYVHIEVFNLLGQRVHTLVDEQKQAGVYTIVWDGRNQYGGIVSSGVYLVKMQARQMNGGAFVKVRKIAFVK